MADYNINAVARKVSYTGSAGAGPYAFSFEILNETDVAVYKNATLLTLTTDYTVTINANGTGSVTLVVAAIAADTIVILGARDIERTTDFVTAGDLRASSLNEQLDSLTIFDQQIDERVERSIKAPAYDPTGINMTLPAKADRANSFLNFDANGNVSTSNLTGLTSLTIDNIKLDGNTISTLDGSGELIINADLSSSSVRTVIHQPHLEGSTNGTRIDGVFKNSADETTAILGGGSSQFIYYNGTSVFSTEALGIQLDGNGDVADGATLDLFSGAASGSVANDDIIGTIKFTGKDKNVVSATNTWADIRSQLTDATANQEDSKIIFRVNNAGTLTEAASLDSTASNGNRLEVRNSATNYVRIDSNPARISALQALTLQSAGDSGSQIIIQTGLSGNIDLSPAGAGQVDVNSDLNVVGTIEFDGLSGTGATTVTDILDEDNMASNSATALATQQSIKAYVDTTVAATNELVEDLTPQLGGNLDLNSHDITGTGNINVTGTITSSGEISANGGIALGDNDKATFGTGDDLQIYHDGSNSYIKDNGTGRLTIQSATDFLVSNTANTQNYIYAQESGYVRLYHSGSTKLETQSTGIDVTGTVTADGLIMGDAEKIQLGASTDFEIWHDNTNAINVIKGNFHPIHFLHGAEKLMVLDDDADVQLYYNNNLKLATTNTGIDVTGTVTADSLTVGGNILRDVDTSSMVISGGTASATGANAIFYGSTSGNVNDILLRRNNVKFAAFDGATGDISFYEDTGTTAKLFWDASAESLGIGTTGPLEVFESVESVAGEATPILASNKNTTAGTAQNVGYDFGLARNSGAFKSQAGRIEVGRDADWTSSDSNIDAYMSFSTYQNNALVEHMRIDSSGNVGINTQDPQSELHVKGEGEILRIESTDATGDCYITFRDSSANKGYIGYGSSTHNHLSIENRETSSDIFFQVGTTEAMRIDSNGNLLVGTTDGSGFTTSSTNSGVKISDGIIAVNGAGGSTAAGFFNVFDDGTVLDFRKDGATVGSIALQSGQIEIDGNPSAVTTVRFGTTATLYPNTDAVGDIGAGTKRFKDLYLSGGVVLDDNPTAVGGSVTSKTLDDYEEGTFTPTLSSGATGITYTLQRGSYTKVGNLVTYQIQLDIQSATATTSAIKIGGLPFTSYTATNYGHGGAFLNYQANFDTNAGDMFHHLSNDDQLGIYTSSGATRLGTGGGIALGGGFAICGHYFTSS